MTRVALISDQHFDASSRWSEMLRIARWIVDDLTAREPDLILLGGDLFERRPNPVELHEAALWVQALADVAEVVGVYGNHDVPDSLAVLNLIQSDNPICIYDRPGVHRSVAGVNVACLPWPRKASLLAALGEGGQAGEHAAGDALRGVLQGLGQELEGLDGPRVLLAHAMVRGSQTSTGQPLVGCDLEVGLEDLALAGADFYALGHIHKGQDWSIESAPVVYPGSPRRTAFGELEAKGYVWIDFDTAGTDAPWPRWERIETPATPMVQLEGTWDHEAQRFVGGGDFCAAEQTGAEVRFRYSVPSDHRDEAKAAAGSYADELVAMGAARVKVEERVVAATRARVPEIALARTTAEKLAALRTSKGEQLDAARTARLDEKLSMLEQEVRNAS